MSRPPRVETGNVLSDIDNMLQDLTDELDAMLKEETSAWKVMLIFGRIFVQNMILVYQRGEDMLDYKMVSTASFLHHLSSGDEGFLVILHWGSWSH